MFLCKIRLNKLVQLEQHVLKIKRGRHFHFKLDYLRSCPKMGTNLCKYIVVFIACISEVLTFSTYSLLGLFILNIYLTNFKKIINILTTEIQNYKSLILGQFVRSLVICIW